MLTVLSSDTPLIGKYCQSVVPQNKEDEFGIDLDFYTYWQFVKSRARKLEVAPQNALFGFLVKSVCS